MSELLTQYRGAVRYLEGLSNIAQAHDYMQGGAPDPGVYLRRTRDLLERLGNPDRQLKILHVAGTAGKGTVSSLIHGALVREGKSAGLFTSPFATTTLEKYVVNRGYLHPRLFVETVETMKPVIDAMYREGEWGQPSYFEICFALSVTAFVAAGCEWAVIEVGCGGTYDATNAIDPPIAAAITQIDYDHMRLLGNTLEEIAGNKAGIIKSGSHVWTSETRPELRELFRRTAEERGAEFHEISEEVGSFYQERNQAVAAEISRYIGCSDYAIQQAEKEFRLPCRFEQVQESPTIILDGAHNPVKVAAAVARLEQMKYEKLHVVIGLAEDKDAEAMVHHIVPIADYVYYTRFQETHRAAKSPKQLRDVAGKAGDIYLDPFTALAAAKKNAAENDVILVIGSFFLAGELRTLWYPEEWIIENCRSY